MSGESAEKPEDSNGDLSLPYEPPPQDSYPHQCLVPADLFVIRIGQGIEASVMLLRLMYASVGTLVLFQSYIRCRSDTDIQSRATQQVSNGDAHGVRFHYERQSSWVLTCFTLSSVLYVRTLSTRSIECARTREPIIIIIINPMKVPA